MGTKVNKEILKHTTLLKKEFGFCGSYNQLKHLEKYAHQLALDKCNIPMEEEEIERREQHINDRMVELFGFLPKGFLINGDPRGYALKIESENKPKEMYNDWGGYGILAPDNFN